MSEKSTADIGNDDVHRGRPGMRAEIVRIRNAPSGTMVSFALQFEF